MKTRRQSIAVTPATSPEISNKNSQITHQLPSPNSSSSYLHNDSPQRSGSKTPKQTHRSKYFDNKRCNEVSSNKLDITPDVEMSFKNAVASKPEKNISSRKKDTRISSKVLVPETPEYPPAWSNQSRLSSLPESILRGTKSVIETPNSDLTSYESVPMSISNSITRRKNKGSRNSLGVRNALFCKKVVALTSNIGILSSEFEKNGNVSNCRNSEGVTGSESPLLSPMKLQSVDHSEDDISKSTTPKTRPSNLRRGEFQQSPAKLSNINQLSEDDSTPEINPRKTDLVSSDCDSDADIFDCNNKFQPKKRNLISLLEDSYVEESSKSPFNWEKTSGKGKRKSLAQSILQSDRDDSNIKVTPKRRKSLGAPSKTSIGLLLNNINGVGDRVSQVAFENTSLSPQISKVCSSTDSTPKSSLALLQKNFAVPPRNSAVNFAASDTTTSRSVLDLTSFTTTPLRSILSSKRHLTNSITNTKCPPNNILCSDEKNQRSRAENDSLSLTQMMGTPTRKLSFSLDTKNNSTSDSCPSLAAEEAPLANSRLPLAEKDVATSDGNLLDTQPSWSIVLNGEFFLLHILLCGYL